jgi:hypothetical protein
LHHFGQELRCCQLYDTTNIAGAIDHVYLEEEATVDTTFKNITGDVLQSPSIPPKEKWNVVVSFHLLPFS